MASPLIRAVAHELQPLLPAEAALGVDDIASLLAPPPDLSMGDLAFPCFRLSKVLKKGPPQIAAALAGRIAEHDAAQPRIDHKGAPLAMHLLRGAVAAGPYVNIRIDLAIAAARVAGPWVRGELPSFAPRSERVMVEYSQPNTHKAFHVGHMRNLCLGDALVRLLRAVGHEVVAANYLGDVGAHIAKCLWWYLDHVDPAERAARAKVQAEGAQPRGEWLGEIYAKASLKLEDLEAAAKHGDADASAELEQIRARMSSILHDLEHRLSSGDGTTQVVPAGELAPANDLRLTWEQTRAWSIADFDEIYAWSGVHFDRVFFESEVDGPGLAIVDEFLAKGVFVESEGAVGIFNEEVAHMPFFMLRKRDGTGLYATKDLALARLKFEQYGIDRSIYVVDSRQSDHFRHVFLTLGRMGFEQASKCEHVPYEMVELPDGAMSTRKGNIVLFSALRRTLDEALWGGYFKRYVDAGLRSAPGDQDADESHDEQEVWTPTPRQLNEAIHQVSLGAIKYGMLARDVNQKIVFDMDAWVDFEGNTGPYLQYVCARTASIIRKGKARGLELDRKRMGNKADEILTMLEVCRKLEQPSERALVLTLDALPDVVESCANKLRPAPLCTYLFELCKTYNRFQIECHVLRSEGELLQARLMLVHATRRALEWGLSLLGIPAPERM